MPNYCRAITNFDDFDTDLCFSVASLDLKCHAGSDQTNTNCNHSYENLSHIGLSEFERQLKLYHILGSSDYQYRLYSSNYSMIW